MYTKDQLKECLKNMGLKKNDAVLIHSSMKSIGEVEGGADTVIDAFMEYLEDGLFMTPVHTWHIMGAEHRSFDPKTLDGCVGIIPNLFYKRPGVVRSLHPTHSMAVFGKNADSYVKGEENVTTPCAPGGCWDRLREVHAKILLIGVTHARNTFIHSVEEVLNVPERLTEKPEIFYIKMPDGSLKETSMHRHFNSKQAHISEDFVKLDQAFYDNGAAEKVSFGDAECILCDAEKIFDVVKKVLSHEINCIIDREVIPAEWWQ